MLIALASVFEIELRAVAKREEVEEAAELAEKIDNTIKYGEIFNIIAIAIRTSYILSFYY